MTSIISVHLAMLILPPGILPHSGTSWVTSSKSVKIQDFMPQGIIMIGPMNTDRRDRTTNAPSPEFSRVH